MWKPVLPMMLLACTPIVQSQSQSAQAEVAQIQKHVMAREPEVHPVPIVAAWVDPHQQLSRTLVTNSFVERQIQLRRDTEKLLSLAAELKQNVDKTNPNILSLEVVKKAQEIEKLAKSVKDKMKEAY